MLAGFGLQTRKSYIRGTSAAFSPERVLSIIAHEERYHSGSKSGLDFIDELRIWSAYIQMNADSIVGEDGFMIKRFCQGK